MTKKQNWDPSLYDEHHQFVSYWGKELLTLLKAQPGEYILDLGCGTGILSAEIKQTGANVLGIDNSEEMIAKAAVTYPDVIFKVADAQFFYHEPVFDAVFSNAALHWMPEARKVIENVWNCLKEEGRFVLEMGGKGNVKLILKAIDRAAEDQSIFALPLTNFYPSLAEYATLLEEQGFIIQHASHFARPTCLEGITGLRQWIKMFRNPVLELIPKNKHDVFFKRVEEIARLDLYREGEWWADYVRLRIVAIKKAK